MSLSLRIPRFHHRYNHDIVHISSLLGKLTKTLITLTITWSLPVSTGVLPVSDIGGREV